MDLAEYLAGYFGSFGQDLFCRFADTLQRVVPLFLGRLATFAVAIAQHCRVRRYVVPRRTIFKNTLFFTNSSYESFAGTFRLISRLM